MITLLHEQREAHLPSGRAQGESLWLDAAELEAVTGWAWKPEGLCQGPICVPLPRTGAKDWIRDDRIDAAAVWTHMGHPVVHDESGSTWVLGTGAGQRSQTLTSLQAPDFELPDVHGVLHRLSDFRGKKVVLYAYASW
jgi:hypothetical protein